MRLRHWLPAALALALLGIAIAVFVALDAPGLERNGVPGPVISQLRKRLPEGEYRSPQDVLSALRRGR